MLPKLDDQLDHLLNLNALQSDLLNWEESVLNVRPKNSAELGKEQPGQSGKFQESEDLGSPSSVVKSSK